MTLGDKGRTSPATHKGGVGGMTTVEKIVVTFTGGAIEYSVTYHHDAEPANPGTKRRTTTAARMARKGLELALAKLDSGAVLWGGFGTDTRQSTDQIIAERKENAA